jgi:hypothetical protein
MKVYFFLSLLNHIERERKCLNNDDMLAKFLHITYILTAILYKHWARKMMLSIRVFEEKSKLRARWRIKK